MLEDLRYAVRSLGRQRGLSLAAIVMLALGIGACTAAATAFALLLVALAASAGPAWRASGIAPMAALRED
jgi:hypothetical protein